MRFWNSPNKRSGQAVPLLCTNSENSAAFFTVVGMHGSGGRWRLWPRTARNPSFPRATTLRPGFRTRFGPIVVEPPMLRLNRRIPAPPQPSFLLQFSSKTCTKVQAGTGSASAGRRARLNGLQEKEAQAAGTSPVDENELNNPGRVTSSLVIPNAPPCHSEWVDAGLPVDVSE